MITCMCDSEMEKLNNDQMADDVQIGLNKAHCR